MNRYMIHTCPQREWYVKNYLIPSMQEQGIYHIIVYVDADNEGHLKAFLNSVSYFDYLDSTWHLQDDVIISSRFKELTEKYDEDVVCGFCNQYSMDRCKYDGIVDVGKMWYSMPCIRISNHLLREFKEWVYRDETYRKFKPYIDDNKHSDVLFWGFLKEQRADVKVRNLKPNIVNHIDHLIGGSVLNSARAQSTEYIMSMYWNEPQLIEQLAERLKNERDTKNNVI